MKLTKKPCKICPYKLGTVKTLIDPCPQCKLDGYSFYKHITKQNKNGEGNDNKK